MIKIIGTGIYGCALARLLADAGKQVKIIDQRTVVGGNCYSYYEDEIEIHKYGSHIFHTSNEDVWNFVLKFTSFNNYQHHVIALHNGKPYTLPFNLLLINNFFNKSFIPEEAKTFIESKKLKIDNPKNLEEQAQALIGDELYQVFIKNYTAKQWNKSLTELSPDIIKRIPVRYNYGFSYFNDLHQGIPLNGYTKMLENMLDSKNIHIKLNEKYVFDDLVNDNNDSNVDAIIYTGPIDELCEYKFGALPWRSLKFENKKLNVDDFQGNSVVNYVDKDTTYTRIHEFKHYHPEKQVKAVTAIQYEYPADWNVDSERYYPIANAESAKLYSEYANYLTAFDKLKLGGRLGNYEYADMDDSIANAMETAKLLNL